MSAIVQRKASDNTLKKSDREVNLFVFFLHLADVFFGILKHYKSYIMYKSLLVFVLISAMIISCNPGKKDVKASGDAPDASAKVEFAALTSNPDNYVGKTIAVEGKVVHVCTESGKKMFLVGENPDVRLFVAAGENISKFPMELLGSEITVEGVITKREAAKTEVMGQKEHAEMAADSCETEKAMASQSTMADIIMEYKSHTVK